MKFEQLDRRMRVYETAHDHCVLPGVHMVARIDGRSFSHLTRVARRLRPPPTTPASATRWWQDAVHLMGCGFSTLYGYTQSDEMSLLFRRDESAFGRKLRKFLSVLAGEASAPSPWPRRPGAFDAASRSSPRRGRGGLLPLAPGGRPPQRPQRPLLLAPAWAGLDDHAATQQLRGVSCAARNELLHQHGIQFNTLPLWQRRGIGTYWESYTEAGTDPRTGATVESVRRRVKVDDHLLMRDDYDAFVRGLVAAASPDSHASASAGVSTAKPSPAG
jgi:tRNA(His) guanylyltransferase